ncbi:hypothetical protein MIR68_007205 [Amoeboaphelidium protococcarum]|nr:hypothetical protein MIR68_007205 [Amoeboaphelidium protococcarum]
MYLFSSSYDKYPHHSADVAKEIDGLFKCGELSALVTTSSIAIAVYISGVRIVIHCGRGYTFLDHIQDAGRGGRNGSYTVCLLVDHGCTNLIRPSSLVWSITARIPPLPQVADIQGIRSSD